MVKLSQNVEAAYEVESTYGSPPGSNLYHLGLLDTFDPRQVERSVTPVASLGQSTDPHHAKGPLGVTVPLKVACNGTGWKQLIGRAIGESTISAYKHGNKLTTSVDSLAILAKETGGDFTLVTGVVPNEVTLTADYTTGGYITCEATCTGYYTLDDNPSGGDANDANFNGFLGDDYSGVTFPGMPSDEPLLPTDMSVKVGLAASTKGLSVDGPFGSYVEVGEKYLVGYGSNGSPDNQLDTDGIIEFADKNLTTLSGLIDGDDNWGSSVLGSGGDELSKNILKGIYQTADSNDDDADLTNTGNANLYVATDADGTGMTTEFTNLKTVSLKIANNNTAIAGRATGDDGSVKWLLNNAISRGKSDVTLDLTMTADDETYYDLYHAGTNIPLIRLDFGTHGSIALTNGTITAFSRPLSPGGEIVDTMSIKFRGAGDYKNFSAYAISSSLTLTPS
tara:strand:- start:5675 stop:7024 length:1350 start_codon:yes stop_codon:yes gene_type:complete